MYGGALYEYQNSFLGYLELEDMGVYTVPGDENKSEAKLRELYEFGQSLK